MIVSLEEVAGIVSILNSNFESGVAEKIVLNSKETNKKIKNVGMMPVKFLSQEHKQSGTVFFPVETVENTRVVIKSFSFLVRASKGSTLAKLELEGINFGHYIIDEKLPLPNYILTISSARVFDCSSGEEKILCTPNTQGKQSAIYLSRELRKTSHHEINTNINVEGYHFYLFEDIPQNKLLESLLVFLSEQEMGYSTPFVENDKQTLQVSISDSTLEVLRSPGGSKFGHFNFL